MKSVIAAAVLSVSLASSAVAAHQQRDWTILDFGTNSCVSAQQRLGVSSPEQFNLGLRSEGVLATVKVLKRGNYTVVAVTQMDPDNGPIMTIWFPTPSMCESMKSVAQANGNMPDNEDIK